MSIFRYAVFLAGIFVPSLAFSVEDYNPSRVPEGKVPTLDFTIRDKARKRDIPVRVYRFEGETPSAQPEQPVILFSHGLGGSCKNNPYLGNHWAKRGYVVVFVQHIGSDESVWKDAAPLQRMSALKTAASPRNFLLRVEDIRVVLGTLEKWNRQADHALYAKLNLDKIGMSGHSFGGVTTQALSGQRYPLGLSYTDPRIDAALVMSPSFPRGGEASDTAFSKVSIPWLIMTGTQDEAAVGDQSAESRRKVYPALQPGKKYELVLDKAEHSAFGDRALPGDREGRNPNHHRAILAIGTAFWDATLKDDASAQKWLDGEGPRSVLEQADVWNKK